VASHKRDFKPVPNMPDLSKAQRIQLTAPGPDQGQALYILKQNGKRVAYLETITIAGPMFRKYVGKAPVPVFGEAPPSKPKLKLTQINDPTQKVKLKGREVTISGVASNSGIAQSSFTLAVGKQNVTVRQGGGDLPIEVAERLVAKLKAIGVEARLIPGRTPTSPVSVEIL
jgi:hypothetical protein